MLEFLHILTWLVIFSQSRICYMAVHRDFFTSLISNKTVYLFFFFFCIGHLYLPFCEEPVESCCSFSIGFFFFFLISLQKFFLWVMCITSLFSQFVTSLFTLFLVSDELFFYFLLWIKSWGKGKKILSFLNRVYFLSPKLFRVCHPVSLSSFFYQLKVATTSELSAASQFSLNDFVVVF